LKQSTDNTKAAEHVCAPPLFFSLYQLLECSAGCRFAHFFCYMKFWAIFSTFLAIPPPSRRRICQAEPTSVEKNAHLFFSAQNWAMPADFKFAG
jgi:hypothetical protein